MIPALATLLVFQLLGEALVPGTVVGMARAALTKAWLMKRVAPSGGGLVAALDLRPVTGC